MSFVGAAQISEFEQCSIFFVTEAFSNSFGRSLSVLRALCSTIVHTCERFETLWWIPLGKVGYFGRLCIIMITMGRFIPQSKKTTSDPDKLGIFPSFRDGATFSPFSSTFPTTLWISKHQCWYVRNLRLFAPFFAQAQSAAGPDAMFSTFCVSGRWKAANIPHDYHLSIFRVKRMAKFGRLRANVETIWMSSHQTISHRSDRVRLDLELFFFVCPSSQFCVALGKLCHFALVFFCTSSRTKPCKYSSSNEIFSQLHSSAHFC